MQDSNLACKLSCLVRINHIWLGQNTSAFLHPDSIKSQSIYPDLEFRQSLIIYSLPCKQSIGSCDVGVSLLVQRIGLGLVVSLILLQNRLFRLRRSSLFRRDLHWLIQGLVVALRWRLQSCLRLGWKLLRLILRIRRFLWISSVLWLFPFWGCLRRLLRGAPFGRSLLFQSGQNRTSQLIAKYAP